jgi:hypothetical protein
MIETGGHSTVSSGQSRQLQGMGCGRVSGSKAAALGGEVPNVPWLLMLLRALGWANVSQEAIRNPCRSPEAWGFEVSGRYEAR